MCRASHIHDVYIIFILVARVLYRKIVFLRNNMENLMRFLRNLTLIFFAEQMLIFMKVLQFLCKIEYFVFYADFPGKYIELHRIWSCLGGGDGMRPGFILAESCEISLLPRRFFEFGVW